MTRAYLGLGSNIGDSKANVLQAAEALGRHERIQKVKLSPVFRTAPVGFEDQDWFSNAAVSLETSLSARELLSVCMQIEREFKRERVERWGPRTLDIDILLFGDHRVEEEGLEIPHPRMKERAFVLAPLMELDPDLKLDGVGIDVWLRNCGEQELERSGE